MNNKKIGAGIITISILYIVFLGFGLITNITAIGSLDQINELAIQSGISPLSMGQLILSITLSSLLLIGVILILMKRKIGVYLFYAVVAVNIIYGILVTGFNSSIIAGLLLPGLMGYFIYKKKEIFGFTSN